MLSILKLLLNVENDFNKEIRELDDKQCEMRTKGTAHLVEVMNDYDLLPTHNFKFGSHEKAAGLHSEIWKSKFTQGLPDGCWIGCTMACAKAVDNFELKTGPYKGTKVTVDGPEYETAGSLGSCIGVFEADHVIECNFYCDTYGICTITYGTLTAFIMECYENGILNKERTGGLESEFRQLGCRNGNASPDGKRRRFWKNCRTWRSQNERIICKEWLGRSKVHAGYWHGK